MNYKKILFLCLIFFTIKAAEINKPQLLGIRYCLKAIEHIFLLHNGFKDGNTNKRTEEISYSFDFSKYFDGEDVMSKASISGTIKDLFHTYDSILTSNTFYNEVKENFKFDVSDDNNKMVRKIWFKFIFLAKHVYAKICDVLESKEKELKKNKKKEENDIKLYDACVYFKKLYKSRVGEYEMFIDNFTYQYNNSENLNEKKENLNKYVDNTFKNVYIKTYKDVLFIEYRRQKTNDEKDRGFDPFPCKIFI